MKLHKYLLTYDSDQRDLNTRRARIISNVQVKKDSLLISVSEFRELYNRYVLDDLIVELQRKLA